MNATWLTRALQAPQLWLGFSGGLDSTVLLHQLINIAELRTKLNIIHFNHQLSPNANAWQSHCQQICQSWGISCQVQILEFNHHANVEAHARAARYQALASLLPMNAMAIVGHHGEDQAETLLLNLFRGAGVDGLAAMPLIKPLGLGWLCRPLLHQHKATLIEYANAQQLCWIEDESNHDVKWLRNYVRHTVMPDLRARWPQVSNRLMACAQHMQAMKANLDALAVIDGVTGSDILPMQILHNLPLERQQNALRYWLASNHVQRPTTTRLMQILNTVIQAKSDAMPCVHIGAVTIRRYRQQLYCVSQIPQFIPKSINWHNFPLTLNAPGVQLITATPAVKGVTVPLGAKLRIAYRCGGETFFMHGQTKSLKKLWQTWGVPPWMRDHIPLLYINDVLAAVIGYAICDHFYSESMENVYIVTIAGMKLNRAR